MNYEKLLWRILIGLILCTILVLAFIYAGKDKKKDDLISAQRTLIDSQREYISTADELIEIQNQRIEACESDVLR